MKKVFLLTVAGVLSSLLLFVSSCELQKTSIGTKKEKLVQVYSVVQKDFESISQYAAKIKPVREVKIFSKIPGRISQVFAQIGSRVREGDVLVTLDNSEYGVFFNPIKITTPLSGLISYVNANIGELVSSSSLLFNIIDDRSLVGEVSVTETIVAQLAKGLRITGTVPSLEDKKDAQIIGIIDSISPVADERTSLYTVKFLLGPYSKNLKPGMLVQVSLPVAKESNSILIPESSLFSDNGQHFVFVIDRQNGTTLLPDKGLVTKRQIITGSTDGVQATVQSGLATGELIIVSGRDLVKAGELVRFAQ